MNKPGPPGLGYKFASSSLFWHREHRRSNKGESKMSNEDKDFYSGTWLLSLILCAVGFPGLNNVEKLSESRLYSKQNMEVAAVRLLLLQQHQQRIFPIYVQDKRNRRRWGWNGSDDGNEHQSRSVIGRRPLPCWRASPWLTKFICRVVGLSGLLCFSSWL